ncbi:MAG: hypothetical protein C0504_20250 [Candidatus Solibacter sp.]|nr:hypothetical protein [Candidatus Solibacter sp.]
MNCFRCEKGRLKSRHTTVVATVRGETFPVDVDALVCDRCGEIAFNESQGGAYTTAGSDAYRRAHGLLTTAEIKAARNRLGLTQQQLAERLKVGIASVKRWELGAIQDESSDRLMRLCTDVDVARQHLRELEALADPSVGGRPVEVAIRQPDDSKWPDEHTLSSEGKTPPRPHKATPLPAPAPDVTQAA